MPNSNARPFIASGSQLGDYVVYADESGDHSLVNINPEYPLFVLAFCLFKITDYSSEMVPAIKDFKFKYFGHDLEVLHERELRMRSGVFNFLQNQSLRNEFFSHLEEVMRKATFQIVATVIRKNEYAQTAYASDSPYKIAMKFGLERVFYELQSKGQSGKKIVVIFESRGKKEDLELELEFRRLMDLTTVTGMAQTFVFMTANKKANITGLQVADLVARPVGMHVLKPDQPNRSVSVLIEKMRKSPSGEVKGWGLKIVP